MASKQDLEDIELYIIYFNFQNKGSEDSNGDRRVVLSFREQLEFYDIEYPSLHKVLI